MIRRFQALRASGRALRESEPAVWLAELSFEMAADTAEKAVGATRGIAPPVLALPPGELGGEPGGVSFTEAA